MIVLETRRLILREFEAEDLEPLHRIFSDPETMKYYPAPFPVQKTRDWIRRNQERYRNDGYGLWAVCLKETGELIGDCGLVKQIIDVGTEVEIGYHINKKHWSKGFATEAAQACKDYAFERLGISKLICIIDPGNAPSIRVAEKIGFTKEREAFIFGKNHAIYAGTKESGAGMERTASGDWEEWDRG
ncbi:GNAT family N-acetyltransferase [Caldibacillus debilis]|uniref:GNAT family N-acetyltransferase n=1 Tax=Caldibacillus debilis TaxID=301148 RepID=UPI000E3A418B|nr:GNAT family N-acetyltransferase [Caldibacillus debilis]MBY6271198.1 GNAT family N-acetyltransferase [Bacillaceae bacterium]REJ28171.1 MAG: GNAT family N-acetyltransferase [Caldibacillus debilis]